MDMDMDRQLTQNSFLKTQKPPPEKYTAQQATFTPQILILSNTVKNSVQVREPPEEKNLHVP